MESIWNTKRLMRYIMLLLMLIGLWGCGKKDALPEDTLEKIPVSYQKGVAMFTESYSKKSYNISKDFGTQATANHITYYFASDITQEEVEAFAEQTNVFIQKMEAFGQITGRKYKIYVCSEEYTATIDGDILYTSYDKLGKVEHVTNIAQLIFGNKVNYGLLQGYSRTLARESGYPVKDGTLKDAFKVRAICPEYLDLNYACFLPKYVDAPNIQKLEVIGEHYFIYLKEHDRTDIFTDYSNEKHREYFNEFLKANGEKEYDNADLDGISVFTYGNEVEVAWEDGNAVYYVEKDFVVNNIAWCFEEDMLNSGYRNLRKLMVDYEKQTDFVKEKLLALGCKDRLGDVRFTMNDDAYYAGYGGMTWWYFAQSMGSDVMHIFDASTLQHEYVHYLLGFTNTEEWVQECICRYYTYYPERKDINYDVQSEEEIYHYYRDWDIMQAIDAHLGHEVDFTSREDYVFYTHAYVAANGLFADGVVKYSAELSGNEEKQSFAFYLADLVGEERAMASLMNNTPMDTYGKTWDELLTDWENYLRTEFAWAC